VKRPVASAERFVRQGSRHIAREPPLSFPVEPPLRRFTVVEHVSNVLFVAIHVSLLLVFFVPFSWKVAALALGGYLLRMWAITAGYHRYFAHRSYKTSRAFQLVLAVLGATTMENGPLWWAASHRLHHKHADTPEDPHSPNFGGIVYAHVGWVFDRTKPNRRDYSNVADLTRYPELRFVDAHTWMPVVAYAAACVAIGGFPGFVWGFIVSTLAVFHATLLINSLAHVWGSRRYATADTSRNNGLLAWLTLGEGWHNNHHHFMSAARQGFMWWEVDVTYYVILVLARLGIVWDVREPSPAVIDGLGFRARRGRARALENAASLRRTIRPTGVGDQNIAPVEK
jgi:stearoyl-CoA desaturase (delta-9 desaturase)